MSTDSPQQLGLRTYTVLGFLVLVAIAVWVVGCESGTVETASSDAEIAALPDLKATDIHAGLDYPLETVAANKLAPRLFVPSIDESLERIRDVEEKKRTFFRILLPYVARENDRLRAERQKILDDPGEVPDRTYEKYDVEPGDLDALLRRVDVVPASLVLAQAALESGWGSSRFARHGNNFFGMRTYDEDAPGIEPKEAEGFKVRSFKDIGHSVRAYMSNLNTHNAYKKFRTARAKMRAAGEHPGGMSLTRYLTSYSEIPEEYGPRLRDMISVNNLSRLDGVRLAGR